jgi:hypothetical protein
MAGIPAGGNRLSAPNHRNLTSESFHAAMIC